MEDTTFDLESRVGPNEMRILLSLDRRPSSVADLAREVDLTPAVVTMYLRRMLEEEIVQIHDNRQLGNQVQKIYSLAPRTTVMIKQSGSLSSKLLQFCSLLSDDIRQHADDRAGARSYTAALSIARIPPGRIPELIDRIHQFAQELEELEEKASPTTITVAMALYPRLAEGPAEEESAGESPC
ncbi:MAG: ArsR family transcriptional regulator [Bacillota bacterium]